MFLKDVNLFDDVISLHLTKTVEAEPSKNYAPAYHFDICLKDGTIVGFCDLRVGHSTNTYYGGNIGYTIHEEYRGNRYASKACILLLNLAKMHNLEYVYITCDPDNLASSRTCELAGANYIGDAKLPLDSDLYSEDNKYVKIYKIDLMY